MEAHVDPEALDLAAEEARRTVVEARSVLDRLQIRLEGVLKLGVAETAGVIAVVALLVDDVQVVPRLASASFVLAILLTFLGLAYGVYSLGGVEQHHGVEVGAAPRALRLRLTDPSVDRASLQWVLLQLMQDQIETIQANTVRLARGVFLGTWMLLLSAALYLSSLALIVGGRYL